MAGAPRAATTRIGGRVYLSPPEIGPADREMLLSALESGWIAPAGPDIGLFEAEMSEVLDVPHAVALSSGTAALHLALLELGAGPGDDVLVSTFTFAASANAVAYVGARPVFVDSDEATWNMDPDLLAEELAERARAGRLPKAVVAVDLYGQCADYRRIVPLCHEYGVPLVEDAAEALGATCEGRAAGSFGDLGVLSFNGNKIITASSGGMLVTCREATARHVRHLATQARDPAPHYQHSEVGYNYRLSNLLAALGRAQLRDLPRRVARRREVNARYRQALADAPGVGFQPEAPYSRSTYWLTCVTVDPAQAGVTASELVARLAAVDIEARPAWKPLHLQPVFAACPCRVRGVSKRLFRTGVCLPSGTGLTPDDQNRVVEVVRSAMPALAA